MNTEWQSGGDRTRINSMISILFCTLCICCSSLPAQQARSATETTRRDGIIDIKRFYPPAEAGDIVQGIMKALSGASAIIIDLRDNQGGESDLGMLMCSYFFARPTQLTGTYFRDGHLLQESWTRRTIRGERLADVPLFLLTSDRTFVSHQIAGDGQRGGKIHLLFRKVPIAGFLPGRPGAAQGAAFVDFCHPVG